MTFAKRLNLDVAKLERGEIIKTSISISSPQDFKTLFGPSLNYDQLQSVLKAVELTDNDPIASYQAGLKHFTAYTTGAVGFLDPGIGKEFFEKRFPMQVNVTLGTTITVSQDVVVPPGSPPEFVSCDNLIFDGGSYVLQGTSFTMWVTNQLAIKSQGSRPYNIGILGVDGAPGYAGAPGGSQAQAPNGSNAGTPSPGVCTGAGSGGNGTAGSTGYDGVHGGDGQTGLPSIMANINIASFASNQPPLVIFGQSGQGGPGGDGGAGGTGQQGGNGGNGCSSGCEGTDGGNGANGGDGGKGGDGGNGGSAVNGGPLLVNLNANQQGPSFFQYVSATAKPGPGGNFGNGGAGGAGGSAGSGGHGSRDGTNGNTGAPGSNGAQGSAGPSYGAAPTLTPGTYTPPSSN